jgi:UDP:flavonoid glycosyltransferase YjiC (YdhE family)
MRVLLTAQPGHGHLQPIAVIAREFQQQGHDVAIATSPSYTAALTAAGLPALPVGPAWRLSAIEQFVPQLANIPTADHPGLWGPLVFTGKALSASLRPTIDTASSWRPDVILWDFPHEFAGPIAAEVLHIPHIPVGVGFLIPPAALESFTPPLDAARQAAGLSPAPIEWLYQHGFLDLLPADYNTFDTSLVPTSKAFHILPNDELITEPGAQSWDRLPGSRRPLVYVTLGTVFNRGHQLGDTIIKAVNDMDIDVVFATGDAGEAARLLRRAAQHVHLVPFVRQSSVLACASAAVTHVGFNTMLNALAHRTPMVMLPMMADQPFHARRWSEAEAGITLDPWTVGAEQVREAIQALLDKPSYASSVDRMRASFIGLPHISAAIPLVQSVVS